MAGPYWIRNLINLTFGKRQLLSRLSNLPLIGSGLDQLLFKDDDILFLPRDNIIPINKGLDPKTDMVLPSQVLTQIIQQAHHHWIMDFCICRESENCSLYPKDLGCLFLGSAAMDIHPKFGRPVSIDEALKHVELCREMGLVHLVGRNKLDAVWLNVQPGNKLFTVCNCCPCCCFWRILPTLTPDIGDKLTRMPGIRVHVTDACVGCGTCTEDICFVDAIQRNAEKVIISGACRACGRCISICPNQAIELWVEDEAYLAKTLERLYAAVDLT